MILYVTRSTNGVTFEIPKEYLERLGPEGQTFTVKPCKIPSSGEDGFVLSGEDLHLPTNGQKTNLIAYLKAEKARVVEERKANLELREKVDLAYNEAKVALSVSMFEITTAMKDAGIPWELVWSGMGTITLRNTSVLTITASKIVGELVRSWDVNCFGVSFRDWTVLTKRPTSVSLSPEQCLLQGLKPVFDDVL